MMILRRPRTLPALLLTGAIAAAGAGAAAAPAQAAPAKLTAKKAMWGPVTAPDGTSLFPTYRDLGVGVYQYPLFWDQVATRRPADATNPDDPAYAWPADLDLAVQEAQRYGISVLLRVSGAPSWANGGRARNALTGPKRYADFLQAAARRYPRVRRWMIWEEPMRGDNLELTAAPKDAEGFPQNVPFTATQRGQVRRYANLVDGAYVRLHRLNADNRVIGGNTLTVGDVMPLQFIKALKTSAGRPPRMDLFGHNPFTAREPKLSDDPSKAGTADFSDVDTLAGWIDRYLRRPTYNRRLPIFISEFALPTEVPSYQFPFSGPQAVQARFIRAAFRVVKAYPRVVDVGWYALVDLPLRDGKESRVGLLSADLSPKLGYAAFKAG